MPRGAFSILPQLVSTLPQLIHEIYQIAAMALWLCCDSGCLPGVTHLMFEVEGDHFFLMPYLILRFWHQGSWVPCLPRIMLESFLRLITFRKTPTDLNSSDRRLAHCSGERNDGFHPWLIPTKDCTIGQLRLRVAASPFTTQRSEIEEEFIDRGFWGRAR